MSRIDEISELDCFKVHAAGIVSGIWQLKDTRFTLTVFALNDKFNVSWTGNFYGAIQSTDFDTVLRMVPKDIQTTLLFNIDLFT